MRFVRRMGMAIAAVSIAGTATGAEWHRATTDHFEIYAQGDTARVRDVAVSLEEYDRVLRAFHGTADDPKTRPRKVTVFELPDIDAVEKACGDCGGVAGYYTANTAGAVMVTPRNSRIAFGWAGKPQQILFHEYAHHYLLSQFVTTYPAWFSEGYAQMISTTKKADGGAGRYAVGQMDGYLTDSNLESKILFDPTDRNWLGGWLGRATYARGWLMTHYLMFNASRRPQLAAYLADLGQGKQSRGAADRAFGDLHALDLEVNRYRSRKTQPGRLVAVTPVDPASVAIADIGDAAAALIPLRAASDPDDVRDATKKYAESYSRVRRIIAKSEDPLALRWAAQFALDAGQDADALALADRVLADRPTDGEALRLKAEAMLVQAERAKAPTAAWEAARALILKANQVDTDDPFTLALFYRSFLMEGRAPTANAKLALYRAQQLLPHRYQLGVLAARQHLQDGEVEAAAILLRPAAYAVHFHYGAQFAAVLDLVEANEREAALAMLGRRFDAAGTITDLRVKGKDA